MPRLGKFGLQSSEPQAPKPEDLEDLIVLTEPLFEQDVDEGREQEVTREELLNVILNMRGDRDVRMEDLVRLRCDLRRYLSRQFQQLTSYFDGEVVDAQNSAARFSLAPTWRAIGQFTAYSLQLEDFIRKISGGGGRYVLPLPLKREAQRHMKAVRESRCEGRRTQHPLVHRCIRSWLAWRGPSSVSAQPAHIDAYRNGDARMLGCYARSSSECGGTWTKMETFLEQGSRSTHDAQIFATLPVEVEGGRSQRRLSRLAAASGSVLAAFQGGEVARWYPDEDEFALIDFKEQVGEVSRVFLDVTGFHALLTNSSGDSWYLNFQSTQALRLSKLKGHVLESASWDVEATTSSTRDLLLGTRAGQILQVVIESKEKSIKTLCEFERAAPVVGLRRERVFSTEDGLERLVLFAAAGCSLYAFVGAGSLESLFQRYQGERVTSRARIYEVPFDSPYGDLQVDEACVGPPGTKVLFWLTGVGVLAAKVLSMTKDAAGSTCLLESPPGLVPFPSKTGSGRTGVVSSFLPAPPPPAPRSMALTKFHLIFAFEDRWVAVSRITHEVVQQQDWAMSTYGPLRCLARDWHGEKLWLCSERHAFEVKIHQEERNVWALLLRLEQFDDALAACRSPSQRMRVLCAHGDYLFRKDLEIDAARKFAEATAVPFEHVCLRFLGADRKAGLLEYLRLRLRRAGDQVTRSLLSVWAVEIALARLDELRCTEAAQSLAAERQQLLELLQQCTELDVHATIYHLLQSHGWLDELASFAEMRKDFTTVILHHVSRREGTNAIRKLQHFGASAGQDLVCNFAPVLFGSAPAAFTSLLLKQPSLDPLLVLPGVYSPQGMPTHRTEAIRYLEHAVRHGAEHPEMPSFKGSAFRAAGHLLLDHPEDGTQRSGWASGTALLNALVVMFADGGEETGTDGDAEEALLRFLQAQEGNPQLDCHFALRICRQKGLIKAMVLLYGLMGMHEASFRSAAGVQTD
ncbi:unnamed protein product [Durusdinium trenchii]|uniref:Pep3/Vps18 beta-propeller domain-containing protein n=1 Tax=Durusdinium trenchii TaxID=1381693 RepID=A0ABP0Q9Q7_9DINO